MIDEPIGGQLVVRNVSERAGGAWVPKHSRSVSTCGIKPTVQGGTRELS
jgi:hypothetical protein